MKNPVNIASLAIVLAALACAHSSESKIEVKAERAKEEERVTTEPIARHVIERWTTVAPGIGRKTFGGWRVATPARKGSPATSQGAAAPPAPTGYEGAEVYERETFETLAPVGRVKKKEGETIAGTSQQRSKWEAAIPILRIAAGIAGLLVVAFLLLRRLLP